MRLLSTSHLRTRLALMALMAALPALGLILYTYLIDYRLARQEALDDHSQLARVAADQQAGVVEGARRQLVTLAQAPFVRADVSTACDRILPNVLREHSGYGYLGLAVLRSDGSVFCVTERVGGFTPPDLQLVQQVLETQEPAIVHRAAPRAHILVVSPVLGTPGPVERIVVAAVDLVPLERIRAKLNVTPSVTMTLLDRNRTILARDPDSARWVGTRVPVREAEQVFDTMGVDGVRRLYVGAPVEGSPTTGLSLTMGITHAEVFAEANAALKRNLWLLALVSLGILPVALFGGQTFVVKPIRALERVTRRLAAGDLSARAELAAGVPGLSELGETFNTMASVLETRELARVQAEQQLRASEEMYRVPFERAPHASWLFDPDTLRFVEVNDAACERYGYTRDEFLQMTILDIRPVAEADRIRERVNEMMSSSTRDAIATWQHRTKDGRLITVETSAMVVTRGGRRLVLVLVQDISERARLEEQFRQSQKMEAVGRLAGGVAHDFNNLLTAILGYSALVLDGLGPDDPIKANLEEIKKAGESAARLTAQLLTFSRKQILQPQLLDLNDVVTRAESLLRRVIGEDVELVKILADRPGLVSADPGQIEQIVMNLAVNARDAMPNGGRLIIATDRVDLTSAHVAAHPGSSVGPHVMLAVTDTGVGMTDKVLAHLFEPFFTTKEPGKGTGLGLATVHGIVQQSGGSIWVSSEAGHGTSFKVFFPRAAEPVERSKPAIAMTATRGSETILVAEDQGAVRGIVCTALASHGYTVLEAGDGQEALDIASQHAGPIHLLLTDVVMPSMDGARLAGRIRMKYAHIRVLYMSGYNDVALLHNRKLLSDEAFLQKPFSPTDVLLKVRELLDAPARIPRNSIA